jgi:uncharacterized membrane protein YraQ (UPF0718 family)
MSWSGKTNLVKGLNGLKSWIFPLAILGLYVAGFLFAPGKITEALHKSIVILGQVVGPISLAIVMMVLLNRFLSPALTAKFLGKQSGIRGIVLSSLAGITSMGPIYAWYPLLATIKEKGVSTFHIANFMACRSIKPVLIPVLLTYFGWMYTTMFLLTSLVAALLVATIVSFVLDRIGEPNKLS